MSYEREDQVNSLYNLSILNLSSFESALDRRQVLGVSASSSSGQGLQLGCVPSYLSHARPGPPAPAHQGL